MKILEKLKHLACKAYRIKISTNNNCNPSAHPLALESFIKIREECCSLFISPKEQMISVLSRNIRTALEQKATAALNALRIAGEIAEDYSVEQAKREATSREELQTLLRKEVGNCCMVLSEGSEDIGGKSTGLRRHPRRSRQKHRMPLRHQTLRQ
eukprot:TRINITY_DN1405_c0_g1_i4.p1 TRINITY_DN1405_c0_g1~~TRINITY_DN1405_c0_g1_i4.p1  ORF type:complete len:155 (+),score=37.68 TRINITY_DN1405_c0_g1_i4:1273-1737(+)